MPLLEVIQTRQVSASVRLTDSTATQVDQYAAFIRASADEKQAASTLRIRRGPSNEAAEPPAKKPASGMQPSLQPSAVVAGLKA